LTAERRPLRTEDKEDPSRERCQIAYAARRARDASHEVWHCSRDRRSQCGEKLSHWVLVPRAIPGRIRWSRVGTDQGCHTVQDQIETKLEVVLKIRLRSNRRRLKGTGGYCCLEHWKPSFVNQLGQQLAVKQR
jgi:hypothetical protein